MAKNNRNLQRRKDVKNFGFYYKRKFRWLNLCVYCGQPKECLDHVFPISAASGLDLARPSVRKVLFQGLNLVPCCNSCNQIAGNNRFISIKQKRHFIQKRLSEKFIKKIRTVVWDEDELKDVGVRLRQQICKMMKNRRIIEDRINWPKSYK